jgi:TP901 family phage tail tape measure protein
MPETVSFGAISALAELDLKRWTANFSRVATDVKTLSSLKLSPKFDGAEMQARVTATLNNFRTQFRTANAQQIADAQAKARQITRIAQDEQTAVTRALKDRLATEKTLVGKAKTDAIRDAEDRRRQIGRIAEDESRAVLASARTQTAQLKAEADKQARDAKEAAEKAAATQRQQLERQQARQEFRGRVGNAAANVGIGLGAAAAGTAAYGIQQATQFERILTITRNNTAMSDRDAAFMEQQAKRNLTQYGVPVDQTARAFMRAGNFGYYGERARAVVDAAVKSAVGTDASVDKVTELLAGTAHTFHIPDSGINALMGKIHQAAVRGNMTPEQFVEAAGPSLGVAGGLGFKVDDVLAGFSTLTQAQLTPDEANTQLRNIMYGMVKPHPLQEKRLKAVSRLTGIPLDKDFTMEGVQKKGLIGVLEDLQRATAGGNEADIFDLLNAQKGGGAGALFLTSLMPQLKSIRKDMSNIQAGRMDPTAEGFERQQATMDAALKRLNGEFTLIGVTIGQDLMPYLKGFTAWLHSLLEEFQKLPKGTQDNILKTGAAVATTAAGAGVAYKAVQFGKNVAKVFGRGGGGGAGAAAGDAAESGVNLNAPRTLGASLLRGMGSFGGTMAEGGLAAASVLALPIVIGGAVMKKYNDEYAASVDEMAKATEGMAGMPAPGFQQRWQSLRQGPGISRLIPAIQAAAKRYGIDPRIIASVIHNETNGQGSQYINHNKNGTTDYGVMQVNSATLKEQFGINPETYYRSGAYANDDTNIMMGTAELAAKIKGAGGNVWEGVRRYNGGGPASFAYQKKAQDYFNSMSGGGNVFAPSASSTAGAGNGRLYTREQYEAATHGLGRDKEAKTDQAMRDEMIGIGGDQYDKDVSAAVKAFHAKIAAHGDYAKAMQELNARLAEAKQKDDARFDKALTALVEKGAKEREKLNAEEAQNEIQHAKEVYEAWQETQRMKWGAAIEAQRDVTEGEFGPGFSLKEKERQRGEMQDAAAKQHEFLFGSSPYGPALSFDERQQQQQEMWRSAAEQHAANFGTEEYGPGLSERGKKKNASESAAAFKATWGATIKDVEGGFEHFAANSLKHIHDMGSLWKSFCQEFKEIFVNAVAAMAARWATASIFGGNKGPLGTLGGIGGGAGGVGGILGSIGGALGGLFGGHRAEVAGPQRPGAVGGGGAGGLGALIGGGLAHALPIVGGGLILNNVLGNPLGKVFNGIKKLFHFDDPMNDMSARKSGYDFASHFSRGMESHFEHREAFGQGSGAGNTSNSFGGHTFNINVHAPGGIHGVEDVHQVFKDAAWHVLGNLSVTTPGL